MFSKNIKILTLMLICATLMVSVIGMVSAVDPSQTGTADVNISGSGDSCFLMEL